MLLLCSRILGFQWIQDVRHGGSLRIWQVDAHTALAGEAWHSPNMLW